MDEQQVVFYDDLVARFYDEYGTVVRITPGMMVVIGNDTMHCIKTVRAIYQEGLSVVDESENKYDGCTVVVG